MAVPEVDIQSGDFALGVNVDQRNERRFTVVIAVCGVGGTAMSTRFHQRL